MIQGALTSTMQKARLIAGLSQFEKMMDQLRTSLRYLRRLGITSPTRFL